MMIVLFPGLGIRVPLCVHLLKPSLDSCFKCPEVLQLPPWTPKDKYYLELSDSFWKELGIPLHIGSDTLCTAGIFRGVVACGASC